MGRKPPRLPAPAGPTPHPRRVVPRRRSSLLHRPPLFWTLLDVSHLLGRLRLQALHPPHPLRYRPEALNPPPPPETCKNRPLPRNKKPTPTTKGSHSPIRRLPWQSGT